MAERCQLEWLVLRNLLQQARFPLVDPTTETVDGLDHQLGQLAHDVVLLRIPVVSAWSRHTRWIRFRPTGLVPATR